MTTYSTSSRRGAAVDFLVLLIAMIALGFWLTGQLYLSFYPNAGAAGADAANVSSSDAPDENGPGTTAGDDSDPDNSASGASSDEGSSNPGAGDDTRGNSGSSNLSESGSTSDPSGDADNLKRELELQQSRMQSDFAAQMETQKKEWMAQSDSTISQLRNQIDELKQQMTAAQEQNNITRPETGNSSSAGGALPIPVFRNWTGVNGGVREMAFVRWDGDKAVFIDSNNELFATLSKNLIQEDRQLIEPLKN